MDMGAMGSCRSCGILTDDTRCRRCHVGRLGQDDRYSARSTIQHSALRIVERNVGSARHHGLLAHRGIHAQRDGFGTGLTVTPGQVPFDWLVVSPCRGGPTGGLKVDRGRSDRSGPHHGHNRSTLQPAVDRAIGYVQDVVGIVGVATVAILVFHDDDMGVCLRRSYIPAVVPRLRAHPIVPLRGRFSRGHVHLAGGRSAAERGGGRIPRR